MEQHTVSFDEFHENIESNPKIYEMLLSQDDMFLYVFFNNANEYINKYIKNAYYRYIHVYFMTVWMKLRTYCVPHPDPLPSLIDFKPGTAAVYINDHTLLWAWSDCHVSKDQSNFTRCFNVAKMVLRKDTTSHIVMWEYCIKLTRHRHKSYQCGAC